VDSAEELQDMHTKLMHAFLRPVPPQAKPVGSDGKYTKLIAGSGKPPPLPVIADRVIEVVQAVCANQGRTLSEASEGSLRASILEKLPLGLADPVYALVHKRFAAAICLHVEPARMVVSGPSSPAPSLSLPLPPSSSSPPPPPPLSFPCTPHALGDAHPSSLLSPGQAQSIRPRFLL
jgi:hypothetical protein